MGRCPRFLDVSGFDQLAKSLGVELSDDGVSCLGEISEFIAQQIIENACDHKEKSFLGISEMVSSAKELGIGLNIDWQRKVVRDARIREGRNE